MYRARQRGWLELDLLVGMWAERQIQQLSPQMLNDFEVLLDQVGGGSFTMNRSLMFQSGCRLIYIKLK